MNSSMIPVPVDDPLELAWYECNDFGNGRRLAVLAAGLVKWVDDRAWLAFDGQRWSEREGAFRARMLAHQVAQHLNEEVAALAELIGDPDKPDRAALSARFGEWCSPERATDRIAALRKWAVRSGNATQTDAMLKQARDLPGMRAWSEEFDTDPLAYNLPNGTLRFGFGAAGKGAVVGDGAGGIAVLAAARAEPCWHAVFRPGHEAAEQIRQLAVWEFDPAAKCPQWLERLDLVQPDAEVRAVFARMYGQTLTGLTDGEEFYVHKGRGGDGKTKTHEILAHGHGDYYRDSSIKTFLQASFQKSGAEHRSDLVRLAGDIRMVVAPEPPPGSTWDGEVLKQVTGGGTVTARGSGEKTEIAFKPSWKLFVEVNPTPRMPGDDKGFRRRFRLIQWLVDLAAIEGGYESPALLRERLWSESSGVLNWLIAGCLDWLGDRRVPVPEREAEALADFWTTGNPLGEWLDEECELADRDAETGSTVLWNAFKGWMERSELEEETRKKWNPTRFGRELGQRQIVGKKDRGGYKVRRGIRLRGADPLLGSRGGSGPASASQMAAEASQMAAEPPARGLDGDQVPGWPDDDDDVFGG